MAHILPLGGAQPQIAADVFLAPTATVVGDTQIGAGCSLWFNTVVRGDVNRIRIGERTNIQDGAIIHCTYQTHETHIGSDVSIGHAAIVHGCRLHDRVLIGMGAKVMDGAVVEADVLVAAGALVPPGSELASGYLYAGLPAKQRRPLTADEYALIRRTAANYQMYAGWYRHGG